ncbi:hypothetical protein PILCRDRAFT_753616 [Piloderma croceum F 1598]|uniref:Uncharacterized protein n=1 Tax=Piloderma croceum (strain F 1598) TaxID=765440 RepID=A0A0C3EUF0_PILCF|nr:hypothetical protein PILCRDRAFT_753616 [Piloderma croceum F 1598]
MQRILAEIISAHISRIVDPVRCPVLDRVLKAWRQTFPKSVLNFDENLGSRPGYWDDVYRGAAIRKGS